MGTVPAVPMAFFWLTYQMATPHMPPHRVSAPTTCLPSLLFRPPRLMGKALPLTCALRRRERAHSDPQHWSS